jgi:hypothetical protein
MVRWLKKGRSFDAERRFRVLVARFLSLNIVAHGSAASLYYCFRDASALTRGRYANIHRIGRG